MPNRYVLLICVDQAGLSRYRHTSPPLNPCINKIILRYICLLYLYTIEMPVRVTIEYIKFGLDSARQMGLAHRDRDHKEVVMAHCDDLHNRVVSPTPSVWLPRHS